MGYTHYMSLPHRPSDVRWQAFLGETRAILTHPIIAPLVCLDFDKPDKPPRLSNRLVQFNGKGEDGHEPFALLRGKGFRDFCKTGGPRQMSFVDSWGKDYDLAVCAVLIAGRRNLHLTVSTDGDWDEEGWIRARVLYAKVTGNLPTCPWPQKVCAGCNKRYKKYGLAWGGDTVCESCGGGSYSCYDGKNKVCYTCKRVRRFIHEKPTTLCYWCAKGYTNKEEAAVDMAKKIAETFAQLEEAVKKYRQETPNGK